MHELVFFVGAGGGLLGSHLLGWRTACAVEVDPYARSAGDKWAGEPPRSGGGPHSSHWERAGSSSGSACMESPQRRNSRMKTADITRKQTPPSTDVPQVQDHKCTACGDRKPRADFYPNRATTSGLQSHCKECKAALRVSHEKRLCPECGVMHRPKDFRKIPIRGQRKRLCVDCVAVVTARILERDRKRKALKKLAYDRPQCSECQARLPRSEYAPRSDGRVSKICNGCQEARRMTVEVRLRAGNPRQYGTGHDPRPQSLADLRRRAERDDARNALSFAQLRANRDELMGA